MDALIDILGGWRFSLGFALGVAAGIGLCFRAGRAAGRLGRVLPPRGGSVMGGRVILPQGGPRRAEK